MKITVNIDCTPVEARQLMGLPDVQPMQERLMADLEQRFREAAARLSPEVALQHWFGAWPAGVEQMKAAMEKLLKDRSG